MTADKMRNALMEVYSGPLWRMRVSGMDDKQVVAIYKSMEREGRLTRHKSKKEPGIKKAEQITMWEMLEEN